MSDLDQLAQRALHLTGKVQEKILNVSTDNQGKPNLHWGQFVVAPRQDAQVGVYGSASAAIVLGLNGRDDIQGRRKARDDLKTYVENDAEAPFELAHNVKLAMTVLALAPQAGTDADPRMLQLLDELLGRCSPTSSFWPAYSRPKILSAIPFPGRDAEVATAVILILLDEVLRSLSSQRYVAQQGRIAAMVKASADRLEDAFASKRATLDRFATLIAVAVILSKGHEAKQPLRAAYREAVRTRDFADRRVFFYECLRHDGTLTRDYFIVPPAVIVPILLGKPTVKPMDRALAITAMHDLLDKLTDEGVFQAGQDMPSTVEQALVGLSLQATTRGRPEFGFRVQVAKACLQATQSDPTGIPTKFISIFVLGLWVITAVVIGGKAIPPFLQKTPVFAQAYWLSSASPEAISQLLPAVCAAWSASRALFLRIFKGAQS